MKTLLHPAFRPRGFALVVTLTLMVLLSILALGLLSLSSVALRTQGQGESMAVARSNARLALMMALGELQKAAGPDKAITATSAIISANPSKPNLTGVWDSWDYNLTSTTVDYAGPKTQVSAGSTPGFKGWLVSDPDSVAATSRDYVTTAYAGETVELVGPGSLGQNPPASTIVRAGKVPIMRDGKKTGNYAWHVADESVKARINAYRDPDRTGSLARQRALLAGHRPDFTSFPGLSALPVDKTAAAYEKALGLSGKLLSISQTALLTGAPDLGSFRHDITPHSLGLLTNVREGGLKTDLTSLFGLGSLPEPYASQSLYQTAPFADGSIVTGVSSPRWSALAAYHNIYKDLITPESAPTLFKTPAKDIPITAPEQPAGYSPGPVIAKVELVFSLLARDKHGPWKGGDGDYMLHMLYMPVFTLHNPYNVNIRFDRMKIGIQNVPMAFRFTVNGIARSGMTPMSRLFVGDSRKKEFWMELADWGSIGASSPNGPVTMRPGQTLVFGPYINPGEAFGDNDASFFDYDDNKTGSQASPLKAKPGYAGKNIGFDLDWLIGGVLYLKKADSVLVEFTSLVPAQAPGAPAPDRLNVVATLTANGSTRQYGGLSFIYGTQSTLDKQNFGTLRYPASGSINAQAMYAPNSQANASITTAKAFALFSAYARTSNGGVYETGSRTPNGGARNLLADGRIAGNPFLHHNPARTLVSTDLSKENPGYQSHELNLVALNGETDDVFTTSADNRTNLLTGYRQSAGKSIKSGSLFEVPSGPLQTIADFRRSNALASPFLPAFVQPVANSYASPLIDTGKVSQPGPSGYPLLDHSVLANHALYDRTYFSTFTAADFDDFMENRKPLANQIYQPYLPAGTTRSDSKAKLFSGAGPAAGAPGTAASYQMVKAPFNVNSTSIPAWKAMLSSLSGSQMNTLWARSGLLETKPTNGIPIPAMTLHNGSGTSETATSTNIDDQAANQWNGYRSFSETEIELLANEIVKQVRLRGPFLSLAEFVNRRVGPSSNLTLTGALQNAITDSGLNNSVFQNQIPVTATDLSNATRYGFPTPEAATGNPAAGAPGWFSQGDIMKVLGSSATVRSDTFVIRVCGQAVNANGDVIATAFAEALVQRQPEYLDPTDPPAARPAGPGIVIDANTPALSSPTNIAFGRRFSIISFRWLNKDEV